MLGFENCLSLSTTKARARKVFSWGSIRLLISSHCCSHFLTRRKLIVKDRAGLSLFRIFEGTWMNYFQVKGFLQFIWTILLFNRTLISLILHFSKRAAAFARSKARFDCPLFLVNVTLSKHKTNNWQSSSKFLIWSCSLKNCVTFYSRITNQRWSLIPSTSFFKILFQRMVI